MKCTLCPHKCNVDRSINVGRCNSNNKVNVSHVGKHMWEEPPISGTLGSGTVFFAGCNLRCRFCQNAVISGSGKGVELTVEQLAELFLRVASSGVHNLNLVSPMHYADVIAKALALVKHKLTVPVVYNTNGYETVSTLKQLEALVDIYLPDCKYHDDTLATNLSQAKGYNAIATDAIIEMRRQQPVDVYNGDLLVRGVIVRHLLLPFQGEDSKLVLDDLASIDKTLQVSLLSQYFAPKHDELYPFLNRKVTQRQYDNIVEYATNVGLNNLFTQQLDSSDASYVPLFNEDSVKKLL